MGRPRSHLVFRLKRVIAAWRYDLSGKIGSLDAPPHLNKPPSHAGGGFENPILIDLAAQCGGESRDIGKANVAPGYFQRIKRPQRRLGAVAADDFCEGKLSHLLAIEPGRALRPRYARKPGAEH